jgi:hypothetical protein
MDRQHPRTVDGAQRYRHHLAILRLEPSAVGLGGAGGLEPATNRFADGRCGSSRSCLVKADIPALA